MPDVESLTGEEGPNGLEFANAGHGLPHRACLEV